MNVGYAAPGPNARVNHPTNRRCGLHASIRPIPGRRTRVHNESDYASPICVGAAIDGSLNITVHEMRVRCADDLQCAGFSYESSEGAPPSRGKTIYPAVPLVGFWNNAPTVLGYNTYAKEDLCAVENQAELVPAITTWANHTWGRLNAAKVSKYTAHQRIVSSSIRDFGDELSAVLHRFSAFGAAVLPRRARALPVFYPFSGFDLLVCRAFFPNAKRIVLTSNLPFGDLSCYLHKECSYKLMRATMAVFTNWEGHGFAWIEENILIGTMVSQPRLVDEHNATYGIGPLLVTCLTALGMEFSGISVRKGTNIVTLHTKEGTDIVYAGMALGVRPLKHEISFLDKLLGGGSGGGGAEGGAEDPLRMYATITKAAALGWQYIRQPEFTKWMVERSAAAISDETGLSPSAYRSHIDAAHASLSSSWRVLGYGSFRALEQTYHDLAIPEMWQRRGSRPGEPYHNLSVAWQDEFSKFFDGCPSLPFVWGYGSELHGEDARGVLLAIVRESYLDGASCASSFVRCDRCCECTS